MSLMDAHASAHNHRDFFDAFLCDHDDSQPTSSAASVADPDHHPLLDHHQAAVTAMQQQMPNGVGMDMLEGLMALQDGRGQSASTMQGGGPSQPQTSVLVEQQMRLNQLQQLYQLQTQIFQQQIELLSGQASFMPMMMDRSREQQPQQHYLPTPAASTELPPQPSPEFVPHMMLQPPGGSSANQGQNPNTHPQQSYMSQNMMPSAPHSAPANIVFQNIQSPYPLPSPGDLDFDEMSPLTSPWLGAYNTGQVSDQPSSSRAAPPTRQQAPHSGQKRRTQSPGSDDQSMTGRPSRKRQAHVNRLSGMQSATPPTIPSMSSTRKQSLRGGIKSANSTPLFPAVGQNIASGSQRSSRGGPSHGGAMPNDIPGDTPSPVDLSMPPPAAPQPQLPTDLLQGVGSNEPTPAPTPAPEHIMPVTPASIMNLGRLGTESSLTPQNAQAVGQQIEGARTRSKSVGRARSATGAKTNGSLVSPALKPIRPAGGSSSAISPIPPQSTQPPLQIRKTSHKAAEQKRRDSLKTSFDDLRILLPPIPLPSEEGYPDEPILPGAMPPRGPPKGNADGPNRGVSKLQLLRCGNDYIRRLNGRVQRRDEEIERLRREVARLRLVAGEQSVMEEGEEPIDLEKDLDAVEAGLGPLGRCSLGDEDGDDDGEA